jgi:hypothetical protein
MYITYVSYLIGCRNCWQSDGIRHLYSLIGEQYLDFKNKTEFEAMIELERIQKKEIEKCESCGSSNIVIQDIEVNKNPLYNFDHLVQVCKKSGSFMLIVNIDKRGSDISLKRGGSPKFARSFLGNAVDKIIETIFDSPDDYFSPQKKGNFNICIFGKDNFVAVQRLRTAGISKQEIFSAIEQQTDKIYC